ncbi:MAG: biopolymer transporter ExbD [Myxococcota bacterium]
MAGSKQPSSGIIEGVNVTPLVDITLVLLIIFIVTAKIVVAPAVPLDLPTASQSEAVQTVLSVAVEADGQISVNGEACALSELGAKAQAVKSESADLRAVIAADAAVPHGRVIAVLDTLRATGIDRVAFAANRPTDDANTEEADAP